MSNKRGVAILISLFAALLVVMFVTAAVSLFPQTANAAESSKEGQRALAAANAGVEYVWCRLQENPSWKADSPETTTVNTPRLTVIEHRGNVFGFITDAQGEKSQFRVRFNYQNGAAAPTEGISQNPAANRMIRSPFVSVNNLMSTNTMPVPLSSTTGNFPVSPGFTTKVTCNLFAATVYVEGLAGDALRDTTPAAPEPASRGNRVLVSRMVEANFSRPNVGFLDSALYGADVQATMPGSGKLDIETQVGTRARMRSLTDVNVGKYKT
ncbi:MAG: hypothetical protein KC910_34135, partial [Candidatus Eremiobacteraeota bacterium]|nr:hypothetical protein [Candidatus Eremiobacteraeota bacterium]